MIICDWFTTLVNKIRSCGCSLIGLSKGQQDFGHVTENNHIYVMPTGMEETPKAALDIHCLRQGGGVDLTQMINLIPPPRGDGGARAITA